MQYHARDTVKFPIHRDIYNPKHARYRNHAPRELCSLNTICFEQGLDRQISPSHFRREIHTQIFEPLIHANPAKDSFYPGAVEKSMEAWSAAPGPAALRLR